MPPHLPTHDMLPRPPDGTPDMNQPPRGAQGPAGLPRRLLRNHGSGDSRYPAMPAASDGPSAHTSPGETSRPSSTTSGPQSTPDPITWCEAAPTPHNGGQSGDRTSQSRKRTRADNPRDAVTYPRKRAIYACRQCRVRKVKCNNARPTCRSCEVSSATCTYEDTQDLST